MALTLPVIYGSVRSQRLGIRFARFLIRQIEARGHAAPLIDALECRLPLLDKMYKEYPAGEAPAPLDHIAAIIKPADGFVIVTGEYNHAPPPALKNLLDHFLQEWFFRPSAIACYSPGPFGGVRAGIQLRATLAELGMPSIPSMLPAPGLGRTIGEDGTPQDDRWDRRAGKFLAEFEWYAEALKAQRAKGLPG